MQGLGFRVSEDIKDAEGTSYAAWMRRKPTVHDTAMTGGNGPRMHHIAFATHEKHNILAICDKLGALRRSDADRARPRPPRRLERLLPLPPRPGRPPGRDLHAGLLHRRPRQPGRHVGRARQPAPRLVGQPGRAVLVHRGIPRPGPRRHPAAGASPAPTERDGRHDRRRRLLVHAPRRHEALPSWKQGQYKLGAPAAGADDASRSPRTRRRARRGQPQPGHRDPRITARHPGMTVEDSYAIQAGLARQEPAAGRHRLVGRKIGLTSKAMQVATGHHRAGLRRDLRRHGLRLGRDIPVRPVLQRADRGRAGVRAGPPLAGPDCTLDDVLAAIEPSARPRGARLAHRAGGPHDRRHDQRQRRARARWCSAGRTCAPDAVDLRWVPGAAVPQRRDRGDRRRRRGVLGHPATGRRLAREQAPPARRPARRRARSCWQARSRARCGCSAATSSNATTATSAW